MKNARLSRAFSFCRWACRLLAATEAARPPAGATRLRRRCACGLGRGLGHRRRRRRNFRGRLRNGSFGLGLAAEHEAHLFTNRRAAPRGSLVVLRRSLILCASRRRFGMSRWFGLLLSLRN